MPVLFKIFIGIVFFAYPFIIYFGLLHFALWQIALLVSLIAGFRLYIFKKHTTKLTTVGFYSAMVLLVFSILSVVLEQGNWLKLYPILISLMMFSVFYYSLFTEKTIIQNFAEIKEKNIDKRKQLYLRKLTIIWCFFFIINAAISTYTLIFLSLSQWTIYNGLISYLLIGTLIIAELIYRHAVVLKRDN